MKVHLLFPDREFTPPPALSYEAQSPERDLELNVIFDAMAKDDECIRAVAAGVCMASLIDPEVIRYRQAIMADCLEHSRVMRGLYSQLDNAIEDIGQSDWFTGFTRQSPEGLIRRASHVLPVLVKWLKVLRTFADENADRFSSPGLCSLISDLNRELSADYLSEVEQQIKRLELKDGVTISAVLGAGNRGTNYTLRRPDIDSRNIIRRIISKQSKTYTFSIHPRDDAGSRALDRLAGEGLEGVANSVTAATDHISDYFKLFKTELAFYIGGLNLSDELWARKIPTSFPSPLPVADRDCTFKNLHDISLVLTSSAPVVGNDMSATGKSAVVITGANQGGKSTFLRSLGQAQFMTQCGLFVAADSMAANVCTRVFTHFKRPEDVDMVSGKFDEELSRMSAIADQLKGNAMVLFNESFAATNEKEGSEIASQIASALLDKHIKVYFVTHQYTFARDMARRYAKAAWFMRAERGKNGTRTFQLTPGQPLPTSYGEDVYDRVFGKPSDPASSKEHAGGI